MISPREPASTMTGSARACRNQRHLAARIFFGAAASPRAASERKAKPQRSALRSRHHERNGFNQETADRLPSFVAAVEDSREDPGPVFLAPGERGDKHPARGKIASEGCGA